MDPQTLRRKVAHAWRLAERYAHGGADAPPYDEVERELDELIALVPQTMPAVRFVLHALVPKYLIQGRTHYLPYLLYPVLGCILCGRGDGLQAGDVPLDLLDGILDMKLVTA